MKKLIVILALALFGAALLGGVQRGANADTRMASLNAGPNVGGKLAYTVGGAIWLYNGGDQRQLTKGPADKQDKRDAMPAFSPDGSQLVYTRFDEGYSDLYKLDVSSPAGTRALTDHRPNAEVGAVDPNGRNGWSDQALWALYPTFSPDGSNIAYTTDIGIEYPGLFLMGPNGQHERRISWLDHSKQTVEHPTWSPAGDKIAVANYVDTKDGIGQIWVLNLDAGKWTPITESKGGAYDPAWSPDGEWIAFTMREGAAHNIYIAPTDPQKWTAQVPTTYKLTTDGESRTPAWSPDGFKLAYISLKDGSFDLYSAKFSPGSSSSGQPTITDIQKLTDKANIDATGGLTWGK